MYDNALLMTNPQMDRYYGAHPRRFIGRTRSSSTSTVDAYAYTISFTSTGRLKSQCTRRQYNANVTSYRDLACVAIFAFKNAVIKNYGTRSFSVTKNTSPKCVQTNAFDVDNRLCMTSTTCIVAHVRWSGSRYILVRCLDTL